MKKNNSIIVLGILSISLLIILSIIQSSTAQYYNNPRHYPQPDYYYNPYSDYNRYSYEQYNYDKSYRDNYDDYNRNSYEQYKKSLGDNYADDEYYDSDDYYHSETYDFTVRLPY